MTGDPRLGYHQGPCTLTAECTPHCGTIPVGDDNTGHSVTRHCACCCPAALEPAVVGPVIPVHTPMCDKWHDPQLDRRAIAHEAAR